MVEVLYFTCFDKNAVGDLSYFVLYSVNDVKGSVFVNIEDFYKWLKVRDNAYYRELRGRHFFFKEKSIYEDYWNRGKPERQLKAKKALDSYLYACHVNNGLPDLSKRIDLQTMSPLFQEVQNKFLYSSMALPCVTSVTLSNEQQYFAKKYGKYWYKDLINEGKRIGYMFREDGTGEIAPDRNFRTMFYDSGVPRMIEFDRTQGREYTK